MPCVCILLYCTCVPTPNETQKITFHQFSVWNALVYFRPQYQKFRERDGTELKIASILRVLGVPVPETPKILSTKRWKTPRSDEDDNLETQTKPPMPIDRRMEW